ncbi:response regulator [Pedobacter sp. MC2016-05]|uniref:response regulator transcription factor n=1 Tax=Pedobacter sp. MC2016-05 TaxID=2994474 RepID=UPI002245DB98|nr:response regulator [Pedobacter sp. MC2016-05]MCX2476957.1 response regulator [Pedobacter sp. MC2016-05]
MRKKIDLLEDDEGIRDVITMILSDENYEVRSFSNITEFMNRDTFHYPDLFLLDVMLPDGNGMEVCAMLKTNDNTRSTPIVMMSAKYDELQIKRSCEASAFVSKPFEIDFLLKKIGAIIQN